MYNWVCDLNTKMCLVDYKDKDGRGREGRGEEGKIEL